MKHIIKQAEPESFENWKEKPNVDFVKLGKKRKVKKQLRTSLMVEQGYICCYCERALIEGDCHIEHFRPKDQNKFPELQLEYSNLICSCQANLEKGAPRHCGNSKENWFDENLLISPLDSNCEQRFKFNEIGQILPFDENDQGAKITIEKLNLDIDKIKDLRRKVIEPFLNYDDDGNEVMTKEELSKFIAGYLKEKEDNDGKYNEFYTTIKYLFA